MQMKVLIETGDIIYKLYQIKIEYKKVQILKSIASQEIALGLHIVLNDTL